jgi:hypothetical protein
LSSFVVRQGVLAADGSARTGAPVNEIAGLDSDRPRFARRIKQEAASAKMCRVKFIRPTVYRQEKPGHR